VLVTNNGAMTDYGLGSYQHHAASDDQAAAETG
jgi:hypothetical protein